MTTVRRRLLIVFLGGVLAACGSAPDGLRIDLDKSNEEVLLRYYLGGYVEGDPEAAGVLVPDGSAFYLRPEALPEAARAALRDPNDDGTLDWDEFVAFVDATYYAARGLPPTLDGLRADTATGDTATGDTAVFTVEVDGVMTAARRRITVPLGALRAAMAGYRAAGDRLVYPVGTLLVGEHRLEGRVVETTVKRRRDDGFWDFAVYDADGRLASATATEPRPLASPTQCTGCHLGRRLFDPEKSFPAPAPDGPYGPRGLYVAEEVRAAVAAHGLMAVFDEHARRSDGVLGLYATLYTARLLADREAGTLAPEDAALLDTLGL